MKFPSFSTSISDAQSALLRFPLSLISAGIASFLAIYLADSRESTFLFHLLLTMALGIPLFFSLDILAGRRGSTSFQKWMGRLVGIGILGVILISFPDRNFDEINRAPYIRYTVFNLAFHLVVAFIPYLSPGQLSSFWTYNKNLFVRLVTGLFYTAVIALGITIAIGSITELFGVEFYKQIYLDTLILCLGIFNTWFFLAGIPREFDQETEAEAYPKGLKIFTQFILIPLLLIYLAILYAYGAKIMLTWDWPKGLVVYLIIAISVLGIFTNLLLFPFQDYREQGWIRKFYRAFYYLLIPLVALLFIAIGIRIAEYSLTVNRYIVVLMGIWLTFISGYFILGKQNIKAIPISLASIMILASFGPWGMFALSEKMQVKRLEKTLLDRGILVNGKIQNEVFWEQTSGGGIRPKGSKNTNSLEKKELNEVNSILHYLSEYHGMSEVYPWFSQEMDSLTENPETPNLDQVQLVVETMGLTFVPWYEANHQFDDLAPVLLFSRFELEPGTPLDITGYDRMIRFVAYPDYSKGENEEILFGKGYSISKPKSIHENLTLTWEGREINFQTAELVDQLRTKFGTAEYKNLKINELTLLNVQDSLTFSLILHKISFTKELDGSEWIEAFSGYILIKETP